MIAITLVLAAFSMPYLAAAVANLRVRSAADEVAGLFQQARMAAVRDNKYYSIIVNNALSAQVRGACVDLNWNGACEANEPAIEMSGEVQVVFGAGIPNTTLITCGNNGSAPCPAGSVGMNYTPQPGSAKPGFNQRGLPCVGNPPSAEPTWPNSLCYINDPTGGPFAGKPVGFLYVLQYTGALGTSYSAVAVTPAGRATVWTYSGKDAAGNDKWVR